MPVPGEVMFSDEWMYRNGMRDNIPYERWHLCRAVCRDHSLGNDNSMNMVWLTISPFIEDIHTHSYTEGFDEGVRQYT